MAGFHVQACDHAGQAAEKALQRMTSETRYPQDEVAPVDRFDAHDSDQALFLATSVLSFTTARLQEGGDAASGL